MWCLEITFLFEAQLIRARNIFVLTIKAIYCAIVIFSLLLGIQNASIEVPIAKPRCVLNFFFNTNKTTFVI